jgi:hypothetical protein
MKWFALWLFAVIAANLSATAARPLGCLIGDEPVLNDAEANQRGLSWREGSKESPGLDHGGVEIGSMYVVTLCSRRFAMVIRAIKKLDLKCRHPRFLFLSGRRTRRAEARRRQGEMVFRNCSGEVLPFQIEEHSYAPRQSQEPRPSGVSIG